MTRCTRRCSKAHGRFSAPDAVRYSNEKTISMLMTTLVFVACSRSGPTLDTEPAPAAQPESAYATPTVNGQGWLPPSDANGAPEARIGDLGEVARCRMVAIEIRLITLAALMTTVMRIVHYLFWWFGCLGLLHRHVDTITNVKMRLLTVRMVLSSFVSATV